ncbi:MAG: proline dehydrogenase, partial [Candidatus Rokuibacteriota bacterium]
RERPPDEVPLQVGGEFRAGARTGEGRDPSRPGRIAYRSALGGQADVDRALTVARAAQPAWGALSIEERGERLEACASELNRRRGDLIGAMVLDGAKTVTEADVEACEAVDFARYYARSLRQTASELTDCRMDPLGVVVVTPPWNFPLSIPSGGVLAALAAGNAVVLKPAPEAILVAWWLVNCLWDAGIPREILQFLPCPDDEIGRALVTDARVGAVILTGSVETARLFLGWRPDLTLFAETSGKNAIVVTALADRDQAIRDLVRSGFGHNGQKCSAASLAICEAEVYDAADFRRQLRDAAASLAVGGAWETSSRVTPLTQPPGAALRRALTVLDEGEEWLLEPRPALDNPQLWSPGIKLGVRPGSFFHRTECFGPVLGLMRADNLDHAIELVNAQPFGLTSGIQTLDDREIERWVAGIDAGNLYVNRPITGAIVGRQPFGGWKASSVGPGAKAGGPNYVLQLARWRQVSPGRPPGSSSAEREAEEGVLGVIEEMHAARVVEGARVVLEALGETTVGRRGSRRASSRVLRHEVVSLLAARDVVARRGETLHALTEHPHHEEGVVADVPPEPQPWSWLTECGGVQVVVETEAGLVERVAHPGDAERLRVWEPISTAARAAANGTGVTIIDAPVLANGRLELRWYVREQAVSRVLHRYGSLVEPDGASA